MLNYVTNPTTNTSPPFTATQLQELEHQALIFKYMVSGVPIPPQLLHLLNISLVESSLTSISNLFSHQPNGLGSYERKADPEQGRCRRTDGKKWRCSKEAYPHSKYCERHMYRGKNRSRKPVELTTSTATTSLTTNPSSSSSSPSLKIRNLSSCSTSSSPSSSCYSEEMIHAHLQNPSHNSFLNPFLYPHSSLSSSSSRPLVSSDNSVTENRSSSNLFLGCGSASNADKDFRYFHGMREGLDERSLFPEASGSMQSFQDPYQQMTASSYNGYPHSLQFHSFSNTSNKQDHQQHCFVLGTDFKSSSSSSVTRPSKSSDKEAETQKQLHHFFDI